MILIKNYLRPFFDFGLIYGTESYIFSVTKERQWNLDVWYVASLIHAELFLKWNRMVPLLE